MFSQVQKSEFERVGVVRLTGAFSESDAQRMCQQIWDLLAKRHGIQRDDPATWTIKQPTGFQMLTRSRVFDPILSRPLANALDQILGHRAWQEPKHWGAPLVTFPGNGSEWQVPHSQWHLDFPARGQANPLLGVRVLAFIAPVAPRGGGTLVVEGSHTVVKRLIAAGGAGEGHSPKVRNMLAQVSNWFRDLWSNVDSSARIQRFMVDGGVVDGVAVRVVEIICSPGDIILMHPWTFHAPSSNRGTAPRIMVSHSVFRADVFTQPPSSSGIAQHLYR